MKKILHSMTKILPFIFFGLAVVLIFQLITAIKENKQPSLFGYSISYVVTPSMEPTILAGDLVLMKSVNPNDLNEQDIVSFIANVNGKDTSFTHRIVDYIEVDGKRYFTTKGDNNSGSFEWEINLTEDQITSKYVSKSTLLGKVYIFVAGSGVNFIYIITIILFFLIAISEMKTLTNAYTKLKIEKLNQEKELLIQEEANRMREELKKNAKTNTDEP
ncbi:MAG: signal peptidase I [Candidatus Izemoplasmatales bacterium]|nr:signal peptidase I [bacterium]MDZ4197445.1 signal peptidase I [Candidatus Izemoplasmatales bacterium]